jgi:hypothetical protein
MPTQFLEPRPRHAVGNLEMSQWFKRWSKMKVLKQGTREA